MLFASDFEDNRVHIDDTHSNQEYYCPYCGAPLVTKKGDIRQHHFAHKQSHVCSDTWANGGSHGYDLSPWHNEWQSLFPKVNQEVKLCLGETKHRADVLVDRTVIEFQHSIMPVKAFEDRNNFYFNLGYKVIWLFDLSDLYSIGQLTYKPINNGLFFTWKNPKKAFNNYDIQSGCIDLFFQLGSSIVRVTDVSPMGFESFSTTTLIEKNDFLTYVGLCDGTCLPPCRDDLEHNQLYHQFKKQYHISLNKQQERALQAVEGSNLLLAVPGSGKTTVLVARLGYMVLNKNIAPESILAITYNNSAANEMRERFSSLFGRNIGRRIDFRTINSLSQLIYTDYCRKTYQRSKTLIEEKERKKLIRKIFKEYYHKYASENDLQKLSSAIVYIKNMMLAGKQILDIEADYHHLNDMYNAYQSALDKQNQMDFDDQMIFALKILREDGDALHSLQQRYKYICVDEAQDTSKIQHAIIALLAAGTGNLFMVGDEDQSIYGFRAAYPEALLSFEKKHSGAKVLLMEENFRSNAKIVEAADKFIQKNTLRHEKHMRAAREAGADIREISLKSRKAQYVMKAAQECTTGMAGMSGSEEHRGRADASVTETAVLYRDNECAIPLIDLLERKNIPYRMRNADLSFFTHRTVLDVQNIIRFAMDPKDTELFMLIYYRLKLFFNKKDALRYAQISQEKDMEVLDAALKYGNLEKYQEDNIRNLKRQMVRILNMPGDEAVNQILTYMGYQDYLKKMGMNVNKLETVKLIGSRVESPEKLLERLEELRTIIQEKVSDKDCPFILSTMHASKGLEYDTVYLLDVMDGILPEKVLANPRTASKEELETYEEERRLFYVGVTRAKNQLNVFTTNKPSKFCSELLGKRNLRENQQKEYAGIKKWGDYSPAGTYGIKGNGMYHGYGTGHGSQKQPGKSYQELADALGEGMIVKHKKFGEGVVVDMEGEHIRIQFGDNVKNMDLKVLARLGMLEI